MQNSIQKFIRFHFKSFFIVGFVLALSTLVFGVDAATYYISPTGSDSNSGTSSGSPWKTFGFAVPRLKAGDTLILRDGTYNASNSGFPNINCGSNANNGTSSQPITIRAENERQALLLGNGSDIFLLQNCSWYVIDGLYLKNVVSSASVSWGNLALLYVTDVKVRRVLNVQHPWGAMCDSTRVFDYNKCNNVHMFTAANSSNVLFEENECYIHMRHCIFIYFTDNIVARRNYSNSTSYSTNAGDLVAFYPGSNNLAENNIAENLVAVVSSQSTRVNVNNRALGNIAIGGEKVVVETCRTSAGRPTGFLVVNNVGVNMGHGAGDSRGFHIEGSQNVKFDNNAVYGTEGFGLEYHDLITTTCAGAPGTPSMTGADNMMFNGGVGFNMVESGWTLTNSVASGNTTNYNPGSDGSRYVNPSTTAPSTAQKNCPLFAVDAAFKGTGQGGRDKGPTILYATENGVIQDGSSGTPVKKLWNASTKELNRAVWGGAVVDSKLQTIATVGSRLHPNCASLPDGAVASTTPAVAKPSSPINLNVSQQK